MAFTEESLLALAAAVRAKRPGEIIRIEPTKILWPGKIGEWRDHEGVVHDLLTQPRHL